MSSVPPAVGVAIRYPVVRLWQRQPKFVRSPRFWLLLALMVPALLPLAAPGYFFQAHDAHHSVFYLVEFDQAIRDGVWWPVWGADHAIGFGYPLWLIYAPLAYYVAEFWHLLGFGFTAAVKCAWAVGFLWGAAGAYLLARRWWGALAGVTAAVAFTYAPYHLVQIYVRGDLAEFVALAWLPWVFLAFASLWDNPAPRGIAWASLALGALYLSHSAAPLLFSPVIGAFLLACLIRSWRLGGSLPVRRVAGVGAALFIGVALSAIFVLPMLLERKFIVEGQWIRAAYGYRSQFVFLPQLLNPAWGFGYAVEGAQDGMSFQLGLAPLLLGLVGAAAAFDGRWRAEMGWQTKFLAIIAGVLVLAMLPVAQAVWDAVPTVTASTVPLAVVGSRRVGPFTAGRCWSAPFGCTCGGSVANKRDPGRYSIGVPDTPGGVSQYAPRIAAGAAGR